MGKLSHCLRLHSQGASSQDMHSTLRCVSSPDYCSSAFLQFLVRLNVFSMCLLALCISSSYPSCGSISDVHLAPASQGLIEHKLSKYPPKARQASLQHILAKVETPGHQDEILDIFYPIPQTTSYDIHDGTPELPSVKIKQTSPTQTFLRGDSLKGP